jgi:hypothetical protein
MFLLAFYISSENTNFSQTNNSTKLWWQIFEDKTLSIASIVFVLIVCLIIIVIIISLYYFFRSKCGSKPSSKENGTEKELDENPTVRSVIETKNESKSSKRKTNKNKNSSKSPKSSKSKPEANDDTFSIAFFALKSQV